MAWRIRRRAATTAARATVVALILASCGSGDDDDSSAGSEAVEDLDSESETTDTDESTATTLSPEDEVVRDLQASSDAFSTAANPPNPEAPELAAHFTGDALERSRDLLFDLQSTGAGAQNTVEHHPLDVSVTGETAKVEDCFVDKTLLVSLTTGQPVSEQGETVQRATHELERVDGVWKVSRKTLLEEQCTPG